MLVELAASVAALALDDTSYPRSFAWAGSALVVLAWAVILFASVPAHNTPPGCCSSALRGPSARLAAACGATRGHVWSRSSVG
jgi:hypothetical protein